MVVLGSANFLDKADLVISFIDRVLFPPLFTVTRPSKPLVLYVLSQL